MLDDGEQKAHSPGHTESRVEDSTGRRVFKKPVGQEEGVKGEGQDQGRFGALRCSSQGHSSCRSSL